jgi:hypothetical protein
MFQKVDFFTLCCEVVFFISFEMVRLGRKTSISQIEMVVHSMVICTVRERNQHQVRLDAKTSRDDESVGLGK